MSEDMLNKYVTLFMKVEREKQNVAEENKTKE